MDPHGKVARSNKVRAKSPLRPCIQLALAIQCDMFCQKSIRLPDGCLGNVAEQGFPFVRRPARQDTERKIQMSVLYQLASAARRALPVLLIAGAALSLTACNTMSGMGQDVSAGGKAITKGADEVKQKL